MPETSAFHAYMEQMARNGQGTGKNRSREGNLADVLNGAGDDEILERGSESDQQEDTNLF